jgi:predicted hotdog family 3-hydroxylacyl-ACP dehydratase
MAFAVTAIVAMARATTEPVAPSAKHLAPVYAVYQVYLAAMANAVAVHALWMSAAQQEQPTVPGHV